MTPQDRRLAVLAAAFVPSSAGKLLRLFSSADAAGLAAHAGALAARSRTERLAALAVVLSEAGLERQTALRKAAAAERFRVARALLRLARYEASTAEAGLRPALVRLCIERP